MAPGTIRSHRTSKAASSASADAELAALDVLWDRMVPGAILILDDYGWSGYYAEQKFREDVFFEERGYRVVELPTGQGMVIK